MKKRYKHLRKNGKVYVLHYSVGLFCEQWENVGCFDDTDGNYERCMAIVKLLNLCDKHTKRADT